MRKGISAADSRAYQVMVWSLTNGFWCGGRERMQAALDLAPQGADRPSPPG